MNTSEGIEMRLDIELDADEDGPKALQVLLSRYSVGLLQDPAPSAEELASILDAGLCAPDHGRLRPWRFVLIGGSARAAFAEVLIEALARREENPPATAVQGLRSRMVAVPLIIGVGAKIKPDSPIPEIEQLLSAGAAAMNLLNAIHALGYGGLWMTGAHVYDRGVNEALGFSWPDRLVGLLFVGTPQEGVRPTPRPERAPYVREWLGAGAPPARGGSAKSDTGISGLDCCTFPFGRSRSDAKTPTKPFPHVQSPSGSGGIERREDGGRACPPV
jgi:nitroreductase